MISSKETRVRPASVHDRQQVSRLIHFGRYVHRHFDWADPLNWLGQDPFLVTEENERIVAALTCPFDSPQIAWVRLFASEEGFPPQRTWFSMWDPVLEMLSRQGPFTVACLSLKRWLTEVLESSSFVHQQDVVVLNWSGGLPVETVRKEAFSVRSMEKGDIDRIAEIDHAAFPPIWQNSLEALKDAYSQAAFATIVAEGESIIGYQISTQNSAGGHLARLAVSPDAQGQGAGSVLVNDVLQRFVRKGLHYITVNTQSDNLPALALYRKFGFSETPDRYQVYEIAVQRTHAGGEDVQS